MTECYLCEKEQHNQIPLLVCGCYICNDCYNILKSQKINNCRCKKPLRRGRKTKIHDEIYKLDMLYSA